MQRLSRWRSFFMTMLALVALAAGAGANPGPMAQPQQGTSVPEAFASVWGQTAIVYGYDATNVLSPWASYDTTAPSFANRLQTVEPMAGYFLLLHNGATWQLGNQQRQLQTGWNLVGWPGALGAATQRSTPVANAFASVWDKVAIIYAYNPTNPASPWVSYDASAPSFANQLQTVEPMAGYFVFLNGDAVWSMGGQSRRLYRGWNLVGWPGMVGSALPTTPTPAAIPTTTTRPRPFLAPTFEEAVLYEEGFESGEPPHWELDRGWEVNQESGGNGVLHGSGNAWARYTGGSWGDYTFQFRIKPVRGTIHINYRVSGCTRYFIGFGEGTLYLSKTPSPCATSPELQQLSEQHSLGRWYEVKIVGQGSKLDVYVDGALKITYVDPEPLVFGGIALESLDNSEAHVDDIQVSGQVTTIQGLRWVKTGGPMGGLGYDIRMRQDNPDIMLVTDAWAGVHISTNGGRTWAASNNGITSRTGKSGDAIPIFSLTIDPHNDDVIWAGTQGMRGIFKSTDGGRTWVKRDNGVVEDNGITFRGFTVDPTDSKIVYAAAEVSSFAWAGQQRQGKNFDLVKGVLYKTTDGGENWTAVLRGDNLFRYTWINPRNRNVMYVSTGLFDREAANSDPNTDNPGGVGIFKSTDGGRTWRALGRANGLTNLYIGTLFMHPQNPDILLAGAGNNSYREGAGAFLSTDGGETWQRTLSTAAASNAPPISSVEFALADPRIAYAASDAAFYRSEDGGQTWQLTNGGFTGQGPPRWGPPGVWAGFPIDFQVDPRNANRIFANEYGGGNFLSEDGGRTWVVASQGYTGAEIKNLAIDPSDPRRIYAIGRTGVFRSTEGGNAWEGLNYEPATFPAWNTVALNPQYPNVVLISNDGPGELFRSTDGGRNWRWVFGHPLANPSGGRLQSRGFRAIAFAPSNPNIVYAGMAQLDSGVDESRAGPSFGVYKSVDGGLTWSESNDSRTATQNILALAVHPRDPNTVYAATPRDGIFKSTDGGQQWQPISQGLRVADIRTLAIDPQNPQVVYAGAENGGIYKSTNGGASWQSSSNDTDPQAAIRAIVIDPTDSRGLYAADVHTGVYRSSDGGGLWVRINDGLSTRAATALSISSDGGTVYAATEGEGVFRLDLGSTVGR